MSRKHLTSAVIILLVLGLFSGCEKDHSGTAPFIDIDSGAELLQYLEGTGDYVNRNNIPLISADELYIQKDSVLIIDVRKNSAYLDGHIEGALNLSGSALYDSLVNENTHRKIILVSGTGEASAYYTSLLRIAGLSNVYTLNFGMGSWNSYFSNVWFSRLRNYPEPPTFSSEEKEKVVKYHLPDPGLDEGAGIRDKLVHKVKKILDLGFTEEVDSTVTVPVASVQFDVVVDKLSQYYIVCAGPPVLYVSKIPGTIHLVGAAGYKMYPYLSDFRSISDLQSLPDEQEILVYSGSGQESAFITAYLRLLGYNASSILLGCNNFLWWMLGVRDDLLIYQFNNSVVRHYPYVN